MLYLRVLAPDQNILDEQVDEVILPSTTGQLGILPNHVSLLAAIDIGVIRVRQNESWTSIVALGGFAEVEANEVTVLVNAAELGSNVDPALAEKELETATIDVQKFEGLPNSAEKVKAQQALLRARARLQATKKDN
ncbi:ATP synthase subunit epsilon (chromatophore) [Paulinella micropora]|uniref:ATP synthase subunit epsilon n=1 Tax=Paulinella micropora TaxID=1928728 RepID=A0A1L5YBD1_9EUKA|nr:ATP synthase subunit epsilon [Paulinella micropora]AQX44770.1 ATP synthase subunit epsilon [Paulinella micropora]BBL85983.1 ATP synthase subunit epsilon [Paulinella micropora]